MASGKMAVSARRDNVVLRHQRTLRDVDETSSSSSQWVPGACITVGFMKIVRGKCPRIVLIRDGTNKRLYHEAVLVGDVGTDAVLVWLAGKCCWMVITQDLLTDDMVYMFCEPLYEEQLKDYLLPIFYKQQLLHFAAINEPVQNAAASFPHSGDMAYILPKPKMGEKFSKKYDIIVIIGNKVYSIRMQRIKTDGGGKRIACAMLACDTVVKALHGPDSMCSFPGKQKDEVEAFLNIDPKLLLTPNGRETLDLAVEANSATRPKKKRYIRFTPAPPSQPMQTAVLPSGVAAVAAAVATAAAAAAEGEVLPASEASTLLKQSFATPPYGSAGIETSAAPAAAAAAAAAEIRSSFARKRAASAAGLSDNASIKKVRREEPTVVQQSVSPAVDAAVRDLAAWWDTYAGSTGSEVQTMPGAVDGTAIDFYQLYSTFYMKFPYLPADNMPLLQLAWTKAVVSCMQHLHGTPAAELARWQLLSVPSIPHVVAATTHTLVTSSPQAERRHSMESSDTVEVPAAAAAAASSDSVPNTSREQGSAAAVAAAATPAEADAAVLSAAKALMDMLGAQPHGSEGVA